MAIDFESSAARAAVRSVLPGLPDNHWMRFVGIVRADEYAVAISCNHLEPHKVSLDPVILDPFHGRIPTSRELEGVFSDGGRTAYAPVLPAEQKIVQLSRYQFDAAVLFVGRCPQCGGVLYAGGE